MNLPFNIRPWEHEGEQEQDIPPLSDARQLNIHAPTPKFSGGRLLLAAAPTLKAGGSLWSGRACSTEAARCLPLWERLVHE